MEGTAMRSLAIVALLVLSSPVSSFAQHEGHEMAGNSMDMPMTGALGRYSMSREASGTSWQPDATPHSGIHVMQDDWMLMVHGFANVIYGDQGGKRGDNQLFSSNMLMGMAQRPLGPGTFGARSMLTLEPATIGRKGYPLLLQTGETDNGRTPLIDRQHPHDFFMELATSYSVPLNEKNSLFAYFGLPGEPALGPPAFMHRFSGIDNPEAPITHHWLDSTHISFGVATIGTIWDRFKLEGSVFNGHEPDQNRWNIESPRFDSYSGRFSYNPTDHWAFQASYGTLNSPEQLEPGVDAQRTTVSAMYHQNWANRDWQTTLAWGRNDLHPGKSSDAFLLESALNFNHTHTFFARAENVDKNELFQEGDPKHHQRFNVGKVSLGYLYDFPEWNHLRWGLGGLGSVAILPGGLEEDYDDTPVSFMVFARVKL